MRVVVATEQYGDGDVRATSFCFVREDGVTYNTTVEVAVIEHDEWLSQEHPDATWRDRALKVGEPTPQWVRDEAAAFVGPHPLVWSYEGHPTDWLLVRQLLANIGPGYCRSIRQLYDELGMGLDRPQPTDSLEERTVATAVLLERLISRRRAASFYDGRWCHELMTGLIEDIWLHFDFTERFGRFVTAEVVDLALWGANSTFEVRVGPLSDLVFLTAAGETARSTPGPPAGDTTVPSVRVGFRASFDLQAMRSWALAGLREQLVLAGAEALANKVWEGLTLLFAQVSPAATADVARLQMAVDGRVNLREVELPSGIQVMVGRRDCVLRVSPILAKQWLTEDGESWHIEGFVQLAGYLDPAGARRLFAEGP